MNPEPKRNAARWASGALLAGLLLFGLTLQWLRERSQPVSADTKGRAARTSPRSPSRTHNRSGPATHSSVAGQRVPSELADETPPWQAASKDTAIMPPGTVPVWRVDPPSPDPSAPLPPPPVEPPNPAQHRPPIHNLGGVDRDRPEPTGRNARTR